INGTVVVWDTGDPGKPTHLARSPRGHARWVSAVAFSPDGHTAATAGPDGIAVLWDLTHPTQPRQLGLPLAGHSGPLNAVAFSPDAHTVATAGEHGTATRG